MKPMFDHILVKELPQENSSTGGIAFVGDSPLNDFKRGIVKAVGPGRRSAQDVIVTMNLKVGDKILFDKGIGRPFRMDGQEYLLMFEGDAIGVLE